MLTFSKEQIEILKEAKERQFEARVLEHLRRVFAVSCERLGDDSLREIIRIGIERAEYYQFDTERDICKYIDLMFVLGLNFDRNPNFPWAYDLLQDMCKREGKTRMDRLSSAALNYLQSRSDANAKR